MYDNVIQSRPHRYMVFNWVKIYLDVLLYLWIDQLWYSLSSRSFSSCMYPGVDLTDRLVVFLIETSSWSDELDEKSLVNLFWVNLFILLQSWDIKSLMMMTTFVHLLRIFPRLIMIFDILGSTDNFVSIP